MATFKRNFKTQAHLATSKSNAQAPMNYIIFEDGNIVAINRHIILVQPLTGHGFSEEEIDCLEGKALHRDAFQEILRYDSIKVGTTGITCLKGKVKVVFPLETLKEQGVDRFPEYKCLIPDNNNPQELDTINLDLSILSMVTKLTLNIKGRVSFTFYGRLRGCVLCGLDVDETILVIPCEDAQPT